jgi:ankyrin repeat protein
VPRIVRHANSFGDLPIHLAATWQSPEFCRALIEAYPGSVRVISTDDGALPFHLACGNERVTERILRYLLDNFPGAGTFIDRNMNTPLHIICQNKNVTLGMVQLLIDAFPDSLRHENNKGLMPLHRFCGTKNLDDGIGLEILKLFLEKCPESVRHVDSFGDLPLHIATMKQSPEVCRVLIEAYPGSERITGGDGVLPFHRACAYNTVATAKYLYGLYPESVNVADNDRHYPNHYVIFGIKNRTNPAIAIEVLRFLMDCNANVVLHMLQGKPPLYWVCYEVANESQAGLNAYLKVLQILYDAYPEAIERNEVTSNVGRFCEEVQTFLNAQLTCARQARDLRQMNTPDEKGQLPLHRALRDNPTITLGSIKLLVKGNPSAVTSPDNSDTMPLHIACQHHETSSAVVEYLIDLNRVTLTTVDGEGNTVLHYACRGANHAIIGLLLDKYGSMSVSKRNTQNQLPIDLLLRKKNEVGDEESVEFTESIFRLLRANPETLVHYNLGQASSGDCISQQNKKKRKIDQV